ncbi:MAG: hypothetical protein KDB00_21880 [Planctomycetales bacterium]|nr:hypothetical protein [Planctomycetales bacterium]
MKNQLRTAALSGATLVFGFGGIACGQTTVQLPSFSQFSYSGSVLVPTGGSTSLGSISRSSSGSSSRGFGGGRAFGGAMSHAGASAHVTIIDNDAIDRQIRGLPPKDTVGSLPQSSTAANRSAVTNPSAVTKRTTTIDPDAEGKILVRFARKQYLAGKQASSFDAYQLAIESLSPRLAALAKAEFQRVFPSQQRPSKFVVADRPAIKATDQIAINDKPQN